MDFGGETYTHLLFQEEMEKKKPKHTDKEKAKGIASRLDGERKAEQNTRERGERRKHIVPGTGREVRRRRERWERGKEVLRNGGDTSGVPASVLGTLTTFFHLTITTLKDRSYYPDCQKNEINCSAGEGKTEESCALEVLFFPPLHIEMGVREHMQRC